MQKALSECSNIFIEKHFYSFDVDVVERSPLICRSNIFGNDSEKRLSIQFTHKIQKTASERYGSAESF